MVINVPDAKVIKISWLLIFFSFGINFLTKGFTFEGLGEKTEINRNLALKS